MAIHITQLRRGVKDDAAGINAAIASLKHLIEKVLFLLWSKSIKGLCLFFIYLWKKVMLLFQIKNTRYTIMWGIIEGNIPVAILFVIAIIICGADLIRAAKTWKDAKAEQKRKQKEEFQQEADLKQHFEKLHERFDDVDKRFDAVDKRFDTVEERLDIVENNVGGLTLSDMHDIKAWIVEQYHKFYTEQGWIDAFNAETIDKRYEDYKREGGNSYIEVLIDRLHSLPMDPPHRED